MYPMIDQELIRQAELEARRLGARQRVLSGARAARIERRPAPSADIAIREAEAADLPALMRLAALDSRQVPSGRVVIAKANGQIRAAMSVDDGEVIADPFIATSPIEDLLRLRALQLRHDGEPDHRRPGRWLLAVLHLRAGRAA